MLWSVVYRETMDDFSMQLRKRVRPGAVVYRETMDDFSCAHPTQRKYGLWCTGKQWMTSADFS